MLLPDSVEFITVNKVQNNFPTYGVLVWSFRCFLDTFVSIELLVWAD